MESCLSSGSFALLNIITRPTCILIPDYPLFDMRSYRRVLPQSAFYRGVIQKGVHGATRVHRTGGIASEGMREKTGEREREREKLGTSLVRILLIERQQVERSVLIIIRWRAGAIRHTARQRCASASALISSGNMTYSTEIVEAKHG